jgi:hypothetical protein
VIVQPAELQLVEGESAYYTVVLGSRPTAAVVITPAADGEVSINPQELRFPPSAWATAQTVAVAALHDSDALADPPTLLSHTVLGGGYGGLAVPPLPVTVAEDDAPTLLIAAASVQESQLSVNLAVRLSIASDHRVTVAYRTGAGGDTAEERLDYEDRRGTLVFPAGSTAVQEIEIQVRDDTLYEPDEQFTLVLNNPVNATLAGGEETLSVLVVIEDDDPPPALSVANAGADEGAGTISFPVRLDQASAHTATVQYATAPGTAGQDQFTSVSGTLSFPAGARVRSIQVPIADDPLDEPDQTFSVTMTVPVHATLAAGSGSATGTIRDDDDPPTFLTYADRGDQVFILNSDWARLVDKVYAVNLGTASAEVHLIATNASRRNKHPRVSVLTQSAVGASYRDPPARPALSVLPVVPTPPDDSSRSRGGRSAQRTGTRTGTSDRSRRGSWMETSSPCPLPPTVRRSDSSRLPRAAW